MPPPDGSAVWVTGAAGFIGRATCEHLVAADYAVRPIFRPAGSAAPGRRAARTGERHRGLDAASFADLLEGLEVLGGPSHHGPPPVLIVHLAAEIPATFTGDETVRVAERNAQIDRNVFRFALSLGAGIVFASSGSVYGPGKGNVFIEDPPLAPGGPYAEAKLYSETEGAALFGAAGLPFAALRISAPYGPGQSDRTVVQHFVSRAIAGENLAYHGTGSRMQDFVHVDDVAAAICRCVETRANGTFNVASGTPTCMRELAELVAEVAGGGIAVGPSGEPDPQEGLTAEYSIARARRVLGWQPKISLRSGLRALYADLAGTGA